MFRMWSFGGLMVLLVLDGFRIRSWRDGEEEEGTKRNGSRGGDEGGVISKS